MVGPGSNGSVSFGDMLTPAALGVLLFMFLDSFHGHEFLRDVILNQPPVLPSNLQQQPESPQTFRLRDIHYLHSTASRLQSAE